jgi:hypothetical protein
VSRTTFVTSCLACLVAGYLVSSVPGFDPINPFHPKPDRPVARFIARLAKLGLWITVFAEPQPKQHQEYKSTGMVCHSEGW